MYPGATGLKYTQTIVPRGHGIGSAGIRVSGRRSSATRHAGQSLATIDSKLQRIRSDSAPTPVSAVTTPTIAIQDAFDSPNGSQATPAPKRRSSGGSTVMENASPESVPSQGEKISKPPTPPQKPAEAGPAGNGAGDPNLPALPPFALRFARGAEMEARRRERMKARYNGAAARAQMQNKGDDEPHSGARRPITPIPNQSAIDDSSSDSDFRRGSKSAEEDQKAAEADESSDEEEDEDPDEAPAGVEDESDADDFMSA